MVLVKSVSLLIKEQSNMHICVHIICMSIVICIYVFVYIACLL